MEQFYLDHSGFIQIVVAIITIAGLYIAWITYRKTFYSKPTEEKEHLLAVFKATQTASLQLRMQLIRYATENDKMHSPMFEGISYEKYIAMMEINYKETLSDEIYQNILNTEFTKTNMAFMIQDLEKKMGALNELQTNLRMIEL